MSASRASFLAKRSQQKDDSEEDYDSEEERYERDRQRIFKKVEESATALRILSEITRPLVACSEARWEKYLLDEEQSVKRLVNDLMKSKENKQQSSTDKKAPETETSDDKPGPGPGPGPGPCSSRRKSIYSSGKHIKLADASSLLDMEKTPNFNPLRKSKARQSLVQFNLENACKSPSVLDDDVSISFKPLPECDSTLVTPTKVTEEYRTPLRAVVVPNQALGRRKSLSQTPLICSSRSESLSRYETLNEVNGSVEKQASELQQSNSLESNDQHTPSRTSSSDSVGDDTPQSQAHKFVKAFKSPVRYSPVLRQALGEEFARVRGSIGSPDKLVNLEECTTPIDPSKVLKGVVAYVEVRRGEDDRTGGFRWKLRELGATVSDTLNKKVTHCVFQEGLLSTYRKAKQIGIHIVSPHWVMACDESFTHVLESKHPIEKESQYLLADPLQKCIKRPKIMSPDLGSGRDEKVLSRRIQRRSTKFTLPLVMAPLTIPCVKTPSPLKSKRLFKSPQAKQKTDSDSDDDWDGFLAMVEAQVREKTEARRKAGEINEIPMDLETRLQQLLGRGDEEAQNNQERNPPLASIFQRGKTSVPAMLKTSPKKVKKTKLPSECGASSSVMMNWLQKRSPESGSSGKQDLGSITASAAASAAADEILKTMLKGSVSKIKTVENDEVKNLVSSLDKTASKYKKEPFMFTAKTETAKSAQSVKKLVKKSRSAPEGSTTSSGAMRNWLSGVKSPPLCHKPLHRGGTEPSKVSSEGGCGKFDDSKKRRVSSIDETAPIETSESMNQCKKRRGEATPQKSESTGHQKMGSFHSDSSIESTVENDNRRKSELTPRRRSLRLTPVKNASLTGSFTHLETVEESKETLFSHTKCGTPSKKSDRVSGKMMPNKGATLREKGTPSKKCTTPSKFSKSQISEKKQEIFVKSCKFDAVFG